MKKIINLIVPLIVSITLVILIVFGDEYEWPFVTPICGAFLGLSIEWLFIASQDLTDNTNWKISERKLKRGKLIESKTNIRISFAYLFRIKVGDKYLLVKNKRNTGKYQPVGGVYKFNAKEKMFLKNEFHVVDDDKIPLDESSRDDYRLIMNQKYLRKFVKRFNKTSDRELITNLSREFREELIDTNILDWKRINYRVCGRHITDLNFSKHFQVYELLLADVVEINLTPDQEESVKNLMKKKSDEYLFATASEIKSLGVNTDKEELVENIADHSEKILQENEEKLQKINHTGECFEVDLI